MSRIRYLRDKHFQWDPDNFKYLGILFSRNIPEISDINFVGKLDDIRNLLNKWSKRK